MKFYLIAGEPSGDLHGKNLVAAMLAERPGLRFRGVGGDLLAEQGMELCRHIRETSFMGFLEVVRNLGKIRKLFADVKQDIRKYKPDAIILIDYPGFNLRMAAFAKHLGIPVYFYISPQVWAWKKGRVKKVKANVDRMFCILPFEQDFYAKEGVEVDYVGHPLLDEIKEGDYSGADLREQFAPGGERLVALLPGSRGQEISAMLPVMQRAVLATPNVKAVVAAPAARDEAFYRNLGLDPRIGVVSGRTYDLLSAADAALVTSGTATLETALFGVPEVVCYAGGRVSVWLARRLIRVKYISLVNLIMDAPVVRELIQGEFRAESATAELRRLLDDAEYRDTMQSRFRELRQKLGGPGASARTASAILGRHPADS